MQGENNLNTFIANSENIYEKLEMNPMENEGGCRNYYNTLTKVENLVLIISKAIVTTIQHLCNIAHQIKQSPEQYLLECSNVCSSYI